jgi:16S rRNA (guanine1207-N2)-methyltransferase
MSRPSEQALIEIARKLEGPRVLCTSLGGGQLAAAVAQTFPQARVVCHYLDLYRATQARQQLMERQPNLAIECQPDFPTDEVDTVALPFTASGEAELTREWMQQGHQALRIGGRMFVATDNPGDTWLGAQMWKLFDRVTRRTSGDAVIYLAEKTAPLKKLKCFTAEFAFRDRGRLIRAVSRPGVFAHRRPDPGARAMLRRMEIEPHSRVVDMGCGSGVLGLAAAARAEGVHVLAIDANPRAVECTLRGAELNSFANFSARLEAEGHCDAPGTYDLFLANPPYYSNYRIAEIFLDAALRALRPAGQILVVTKLIDWHLETMGQRFAHVEAERVGEYHVIAARKPT